ALAAVVHLELRREAAAAEEGAEPAERVSCRRLDLDDVGAPIGEDAGGRRSRHPHADLDGADALQRPAHLRLPLLHGGVLVALAEADLAEEGVLAGLAAEELQQQVHPILRTAALEDD